MEVVHRCSKEGHGGSTGLQVGAAVECYTLVTGGNECSRGENNWC